MKTFLNIFVLTISLLLIWGNTAFGQQNNVSNESETNASKEATPELVPIIPLTFEPENEVVDERNYPAKKEEPVSATEGDLFVDPEFDIPMVTSEPEEQTAKLSTAEEKGFKPKFEYGGEVRARYGNDLAYEYSLIQETPGAEATKKGTEDVIDFRTSAKFWTRLSLTENIQAFLEIYTEFSVLGKRNENDPTIIFNGKDYRTGYKLEPWEMYFDFFFGSFDLRVGNQIVSWGTMTVMSPSDRLNPRDVNSYYWSDISGSKQPLVAIKGIYHISDLAFEFVISPFFTPPPLDIYGGDYSLFRYGSAYGQSSYPIADVNYYLHDSVTINQHPELLMTDNPGANPLNSQLGFRFSGSKAGVDFGISYLFGYEELPTTNFDPEVRAMAEAVMRGDTNMVNGYLTSLQERINAGTPIDDLVSSEYRRKHSVAVEFGTTIWEFGLKAEAAFLPDKTYYTEGLYPTTHHTLSYAVGLDLLKMDLGSVSTLYVDLELFGSILFGVETNEQLVFTTDKNMSLFTTIRLAFLDDDLEFELLNQTNFSTKDYVIIPKVSYTPVRNLRLTLGVMLMEAWAKEPVGYNVYSSNPDRKDTIFGRYSNNDQAFFMVRYSF